MRRSALPREAAASVIAPEAPVLPAAEAVHHRVREAVIAGFSWTVGLAGAVWGSIYLLLGVPSAAVYPYGFAILTLANVLVFRSSKRLGRFAAIELALILVAPFGLAVHLGGFTASGAIPLWSSLAPVGAMMILGPASAALFFGLFVAATVYTVLGEASLAAAAALPALAVEIFALLNVVGVSSVAFWLVRTFVTTNAALQRQQQQLRELEQAYLSQELLIRQQERLATLGKLSAGVAHELNNPAAAAVRASADLDLVVGRLTGGAVRLLELGMDAECLLRLGAAVSGPPPEDPLERSDRVDALAGRLRGPLAGEADEVAEALVALGYEVDGMSEAAAGFEPAEVAAAARWVAASGSARMLLVDVRESIQRVSDIVRALKGYSHMDRASHAPVDLVQGLEDTLIILRGKLAGVQVRREFEPDLPEVLGNAGELNQVWTNLIANAAEALSGSGALTLRLARAEQGVRIDVEDDGPGIPPELQGRVFDPFVTTKAPGEGTGLGLHLAHRTVTERHLGTITAASRPGCTRFTVTLPTAAAHA